MCIMFSFVLVHNYTSDDDMLWTVFMLQCHGWQVSTTTSLNLPPLHQTTSEL